MPVRPPFTADPFEVALCAYLNLKLDEVVAGSFETPTPTLVTWEHVDVDGKHRLRSVKFEPGVLEHLRERVEAEQRSARDGVVWTWCSSSRTRPTIWPAVRPS